MPGAARRSSRHLPPGPRSHHLELVARADSAAAPAGAYSFDFAERGALDPRSGVFTLEFPCGIRQAGESGEPVGRCQLRGRLADLLGSVVGVGAEARHSGAGWCAKGGQKLPVWAHTPSLHLSRAMLEGR